MMPAKIIRVPAAGSQLKMNVVEATGSPGGVEHLEARATGTRRSRAPRRANSLTAVMLAIEKIAMITAYGA